MILSWFRRNIMHALRCSLLVSALAGTVPFAFADAEVAAAWGPSIGSPIPLLAAKDQDGKQQTLETLRGSSGLLIVFNRSVDW